jgi:hypothetical protein
MVVLVAGHVQLLNETSNIMCCYSDILNQFWFHNIFVLHINLKNKLVIKVAIFILII